MKPALLKEIDGLSREEKREVYDYLGADLGEDDWEISPELMAELERRIAEDEANPDDAITMEEFRRIYIDGK